MLPNIFHFNGALKSGILQNQEHRNTKLRNTEHLRNNGGTPEHWRNNGTLAKQSEYH